MRCFSFNKTWPRNKCVVIIFMAMKVRAERIQFSAYLVDAKTTPATTTMTRSLTLSLGKNLIALISISENWAHAMAYSSITYVAVFDWGVNYCSPVHGTHKLSFGFARQLRTLIINGHKMSLIRYTRLMLTVERNGHFIFNFRNKILKMNLSFDVITN